MEIIKHLLIGLSTGFEDKEKLHKIINKLLMRCQPTSITLINDSKNIFEPEQIRFTGNLSRISIPINRLEIRNLVTTASHILIFWSGEDLNQLIWEAKYQKKPLRISTFYWTRAVNKDQDDEFDIYIGRGGPWGNPFPIINGTDQTREIVIEKFKDYFEKTILTDPVKHKALLELRGLRLGCHCKPQACHGDIISDYLNNYREPEE